MKYFTGDEWPKYMVKSFGKTHYFRSYDVALQHCKSNNLPKNLIVKLIKPKEEK